MTEEQNEAGRSKVRDGYTKIAQNPSTGCCGPRASRGSATEHSGRLAEELGYKAEELEALPDGANMGLSCGNPAALAALRREFPQRPQPDGRGVSQPDLRRRA